MLQISQICRDRVPRSRFRRSRVDHCGCAWHFWIMSLGVLAPPGDGFHGPVPHGAQGLALCVCGSNFVVQPSQKEGQLGYEFRGFFSGGRGGGVVCVCVWWGGGLPLGTRVSRSSRVTRLSLLPTFFLQCGARRQTTLRRVSTFRPRTVHGARNRTGLRKQTSWRSYQRTGRRPGPFWVLCFPVPQFRTRSKVL